MLSQRCSRGKSLLLLLSFRCFLALYTSISLFLPVFLVMCSSSLNCWSGMTPESLSVRSNKDATKRHQYYVPVHVTSTSTATHLCPLRCTWALPRYRMCRRSVTVFCPPAWCTPRGTGPGRCPGRLVCHSRARDSSCLASREKNRRSSTSSSSSSSRTRWRWMEKKFHSGYFRKKRKERLISFLKW